MLKIYPADNAASDHIRPLLTSTKLREIIKEFSELLLTVEYDAIAFKGNSGAMFAGALSYETGKPLILVRKEAAHSNRKVETNFNLPKAAIVDFQLKKSFKYIIVDDLIFTSSTVSDIEKSVREFYLQMNVKAELELILLFQDYRTESFVNGKKYKVISKSFY